MDVDKQELEEDIATYASLLLVAGNILRIFILICSAVSCLQVECRPGYKKVVPEGECCPRCVLDNQCEEMQKKGLNFSEKFLINEKDISAEPIVVKDTSLWIPANVVHTAKELEDAKQFDVLLQIATRDSGYITKVC